MNPSQTELVILKHLWAAGAQSVREIHDAVSPILGWSRSSTRKTLERMLEKELLMQVEVHGLNVYEAKAKKVPTLAAMVKSFAASVLGLSGPMPVSQLTGSDLLTEKELKELELHLAKLNAEERAKHAIDSEARDD